MKYNKSCLKCLKLSALEIIQDNPLDFEHWVFKQTLPLPKQDIFKCLIEKNREKNVINVWKNSISWKRQFVYHKQTLILKKKNLLAVRSADIQRNNKHNLIIPCDIPRNISIDGNKLHWWWFLIYWFVRFASISARIAKLCQWKYQITNIIYISPFSKCPVMPFVGEHLYALPEVHRSVWGAVCLLSMS